MIRIILINLLMFLAPFIIFGTYIYFAKKPKNKDQLWAQLPVIWLSVIGVFLMIGALLSLVSLDVGKPEMVYVPAVVKDGKVIPGHFVPKEKANDHR